MPNETLGGQPLPAFLGPSASPLHFLCFRYTVFLPFWNMLRLFPPLRLHTCGPRCPEHFSSLPPPTLSLAGLILIFLIIVVNINISVTTLSKWLSHLLCLITLFLSLGACIVICGCCDLKSSCWPPRVCRLHRCVRLCCSLHSSTLPGAQRV